MPRGREPVSLPQKIPLRERVLSAIRLYRKYKDENIEMAETVDEFFLERQIAFYERFLVQDKLYKEGKGKDALPLLETSGRWSRVSRRWSKLTDDWHPLFGAELEVKGQRLISALLELEQAGDWSKESYEWSWFWEKFRRWWRNLLGMDRTAQWLQSKGCLLTDQGWVLPPGGLQEEDEDEE